MPSSVKLFNCLLSTSFSFSGLRRRSAAARLLRSWVRIPPGAWTFVCCECCVLSGRGLCDELITRPEESYRLWCVVVCDLENPKNEEAMPRVGSQRHRKRKCNVLLESVRHVAIWNFLYLSLFICSWDKANTISIRIKGNCRNNQCYKSRIIHKQK